MAIPNFTPVENYDAFKILKESQLNSLADSIKTQFDTYTKLNFTQFALDVFGASYVFNNDGIATQPAALNTLTALLADNETVSGSWTFSGTTTFSAAVTSSSTFTSSGQPRAKAYLTTANQSIPDSAATSVTLNGETFDIGTMHDNSTNNSRLTVPSGGSGVYHVTGQVVFAVNATGKREAYIYKNGTVIAKAGEISASAGVQTIIQVSVIDAAVATDYFEMVVYQNSGGALDIVTGERITNLTAMKVW